eukprot:TRINITY_DN5020_c0_g1_i8.p1 TRINITY_DN5020_c0_g1~~TRINITY_DN5020_c0_g1_i8.p1  ORF type:complete len:503 (-),score=96.78 TRINITY_DN5020_c0_g1_i8:681-2189(-)
MKAVGEKRTLSQGSLVISPIVRGLTRSSSASHVAEGAQLPDLIRAASVGDIDYIQKLRRSVNIDQADAKGKTPLMIACGKGQLGTVKYLITKQASLTAKDSQLWSPLHYAAHGGYLDVVLYLLKKGHDPNARNSDRTSCLHYIVRLEFTEKLKKTINTLLKCGATIDAKNKFDETPLQAAVVRGKIAVTKYLLSKNANINARNKFGDSALQMAVTQGDLDMVKMLLECGANPTIKSEGQFGDMMKTATRFEEEGKPEIKKNLQEYTKRWLFQHVALDPVEEQWKTLSVMERLRNSVLVNCLDFDFSNQLNVANFLYSFQKSLVGDHDGWITEEGAMKIPKKIQATDIEFSQSEYRDNFYRKVHFNFIGSEVLGKDTDPLIVSVATYEETDGDYKTLIWSIRGTTCMTTPVELTNPSDLVISAKRLSSYLRSFFEQKYTLPINVKLEPILPNFWHDLEQELLQMELSDPQMPRMMSVGVIYCKEDQKEEEEYFQNAFFTHPLH